MPQEPPSHGGAQGGQGLTYHAEQWTEACLTTPTGVISHQPTPISSLLPLGSFNFSFAGMSDSLRGQYIEPQRDASLLHTPPAPQYTDLVNVALGGYGLTSRTATPTHVVRTLHSPASNDRKDSQDDQSHDGVV